MTQMGYESASWAGNALPRQHQSGILPLSTGAIADDIPRASGRSTIVDIPPASQVPPPQAHRTASAAPPARYQPSSPVLAPEFEAIADEAPTDENANQIVSYLQIPPTINNSKGSLSDFAAQVCRGRASQQNRNMLITW